MPHQITKFQIWNHIFFPKVKGPIRKHKQFSMKPAVKEKETANHKYNFIQPSGLAILKNYLLCQVFFNLYNLRVRTASVT